MKVIMLCNGQANQRALARRISARTPLASIVVQGHPAGQAACGAARVSLRRRVSAVVGAGLTFFAFRRAWHAMLSYYETRCSGFPQDPVLYCNDINQSEVINFIEQEAPDLVIVSGTNLLRNPLIKTISRCARIMNLHTGISPYVRGGPNCTNWCLYLNEFEKIGNTIMWLDEGIDSGNLIATARTPLSGDETLAQLHIKVMNHAHELYSEAVYRFVHGQSLPSVPQTRFHGSRLFMSKQWGAWQMVVGLWHFLVFYRPKQLAMACAAAVPLVALEGPTADGMPCRPTDSSPKTEAGC
jgi:folate-dependent phosphoribosylglycinamide formyltransferase PurN